MTYQPPDPYGVSAVVADVAAQIAQQYGVNSTTLVDIALATMQQESGGNPQAVGDNGTSFGLFQLHEGGELGGLSQQQAFDPTTNARVAITVMAQVLKAHPDWSPGQVAAAAQRPADQTAYANSVNSLLGGGTGGTTGGGTVGTASAPVGGGAPAGPVPSMADIPALDTYIRQNFGTDAWLLDIPDVKSVLEQAVVNGDDTAQVQAAIQQTQWWQQTSQAVKNYEQELANNPADYSFSTPGSIANQTVAQIQSTAAQQGVQLSLQQAQTIATNALKYGWNSQQIQQAVGSTVTYGGPGSTNAGSLTDQMNNLAGQYLQKPSEQVTQSWAANIAAGTQTLDQYKAYLANNAALKWTGMAGQIMQGYTPNQIIDSYRQEAAKTMEVDPNSLDFVNDPTYSKIIDYVPPNSTNGVHRLMTLSEMDQYLKGTPQWGYTQNARDTAATFEQTVAQTWGKVG